MLLFFAVVRPESMLIFIFLFFFFSFCAIEIWNRLGIRKEDLPKYEEELELKVAKAELQELKKNAVEAMETQLKRSVSLSP